MSTPEKQVILISESILLKGIVPTDLLDAERFEVRSVHLIDEISILSQVQTPAAVVLDLAQLTQHPRVFVASLPQEKGPIPILGVSEGPIPFAAEELFGSGFNYILSAPITTETLQNSMQALLGLRFRRFERKPVEVALHLETSEEPKRSWQVIGRVINYECIAVTGSPLPPPGINVFIRNAQGDAPLPFQFWGYCWKELKGSLLLRFLDPPQEFLDAVNRLPSQLTKPSPPSVETPPPEAATAPAPQPTQTYVHLNNPGTLAETDISKMLPKIRLWLNEPDAAPSKWKNFIGKIKENDREFLLEKNDSQNRIAEAYTLRMLLQAQLDELRISTTASDEETKKRAPQILAAHDRKVRECNQELQKAIVLLITQSNSKSVNDVNLLKTELQKLVIALRKTLELKGFLATAQASRPLATSAGAIPTQPADFSQGKEISSERLAARRDKERRQTVASTSRKALVTALLLLIPVIGFGYAYWQWSAPQRKVSELSPTDIARLSPYFQSARQVKTKNQRNLMVRLKNTWNDLDESRQALELASIADKFREAGITHVELMNAKGRRIARFRQGRFQEFGADGRPLKASRP